MERNDFVCPLLPPPVHRGGTNNLSILRRHTTSQQRQKQSKRMDISFPVHRHRVRASPVNCKIRGRVTSAAATDWLDFSVWSESYGTSAAVAGLRRPRPPT